MFPADEPLIKANYANFGHIPYGQSLIGQIYFDKDNMDGCKKMNLETSTNIPGVTPFAPSNNQ